VLAVVEAEVQHPRALLQPHQLLPNYRFLKPYLRKSLYQQSGNYLAQVVILMKQPIPQLLEFHFQLAAY
jgi:hypothetical protein